VHQPHTLQRRISNSGIIAIETNPMRP
jgi:hypothetical protein